MQLIIDLNESDLTPIIESMIKKLLRYTGESYGQGELTVYVQQQTKAALIEQLRQIDIHGRVAKTFQSEFDAIVQDIVRKEIERITKKTIKELKDKGELLT